jgi:hypothetical protein
VSEALTLLADIDETLIKALTLKGLNARLDSLQKSL